MKQPDSGRKPVILISLLTAACLLGDSMLYVVLPIHWQEAGLTSLWEVGILLSANRLARLPLNPLVGWLYGRMSSRSGILFAALLATATTFAYGFAQGFLFWLLLRCIWGLSWTFLRLGAYFTILDVATADNRGHYMGLYNGLYRLGSLGGMLLGGVLADQYGIGLAATFFGALTFLAIPFAIRLIPSSQHHSQSEPAANTASSLMNPNIIWTLFTGMVLALIYQGVFTSTLSYLIQIHYSTTIVLLGISVGAASLSGVIQALRWGWEPWLAPWFGKLSDGKYGRTTILTATLVLAAIAFALIPLSLPMELWLMLIMFILLTATILTTVIDAIACDVACCFSQKTFMTAYSFAIDVGAALGPMLGYALNDLWGPYAIYLGVTVMLTLLAAKWLLWPLNCTSPG